MITDPITAARALIKSLTGYTLGPWRKHGNGKQIVSADIIIATCVWGEVKANTRLIAAAPALREMVATLADALEEERDQALARLAFAQREMRDRAAQVLDEDYSIGGVNTELDRRICCNGQMCGCMGATVGHYLQHQIRSLEPSPDAKAALDKLLAEARLEGWRAGRDAAAVAARGDGEGEWFNPVQAIRAMPEPQENSHD